MGKYKPIVAGVVFYAIAIMLRYLTNKTEILSAVGNDYLKIILQGISPAIGTLVACLLFRIRLNMSLGGNYRNILLPLAIYWGVAIFVITGVAYFAEGTFPWAAAVTVLIYGLLEETGWRGFLQQIVKPLPKVATIFIIAAMWFIWHLNFECSLSNLLFFCVLLFGSWGIGLVADKTKSLLAVAAFHSVFNFSIIFSTRKYYIITVSLLFTFWILNIIYRERLKKNQDISSLNAQ